jgi:hypothetical protein
MNMTPSDWMNMKPSDWMDATRSDWMNRTSGLWNKSFSEMINATPTDWWAMVYGPGTGMPSAGMSSAWTSATAQGQRRRGWDGRECDEDTERWQTHHHHGCRRCGSDPCQCACCIGDVDFAVYSRLGEQRVIPIVLENERRRDKQITLELSGWTTRGGNVAPVETVLLEPKAFTLATCGEQKITLVVKVAASDGRNTGEPNPPQQPGGGDTGRTSQPDVDNCLVATADLRLVGCDHRPLRIAVAVLPRDCDPYTVPCGCTCC